MIYSASEINNKCRCQQRLANPINYSQGGAINSREPPESCSGRASVTLKGESAERHWPLPAAKVRYLARPGPARASRLSA